jgi:hypothetical protein
VTSTDYWGFGARAPAGIGKDGASCHGIRVARLHQMRIRRKRGKDEEWKKGNFVAPAKVMMAPVQLCEFSDELEK